VSEDARIAANTTGVLAEAAITDVGGAVFDRPVMADRLSAEGGGQQELADEIRELAGRLPKAGSGLASVGGTGDPNEGADVISPFGISEGGVWVENLDDAGFRHAIAAWRPWS